MDSHRATVCFLFLNFFIHEKKENQGSESACRERQCAIRVVKLCGELSLTTTHLIPVGLIVKLHGARS